MPRNLSRRETDLVDAFKAGDLGKVEFFELAMETSLTVEEINAVLEGETSDD